MSSSKSQRVGFLAICRQDHVGWIPKKWLGESLYQPQMLHGAGIFTYIWAIFVVNIGKYSVHGAFGNHPFFCIDS